MSRAIPWIVIVAAVAGLIASASEISRLKARIGRLEHPQQHVHAEVREFMIQATLAEVDQPIVVLGDSVAEMAPLPRQLCGHPVVNAGVGGMNIREATALALRLFTERPPFLIALAVGANDVGSTSASEDYLDLLATTKKLSKRLVSISVTSDPELVRQVKLAAAAEEVRHVEPQLPPNSKTPDGIHYRGIAYARWVPVLESAIQSEIKECR